MISPDGYGRAIATAAVAQVLNSLGLHHTHRSVLDSLTDITICYITSIATSAKLHSNSAGRVQSNLLDLLRSLEDLTSPPENTTILLSIHRYIAAGDTPPFAHPLPHIPVSVSPRGGSSSASAPRDHIPRWLPPFPDPRTYIVPSVEEESLPEMKVDKLERARQRRHAEGSLLSLERRLGGNGRVDQPVRSVVDCFAEVIGEIEKGRGEIGDGLGRRGGEVRFRLGFDRRMLSPAVALVDGDRRMGDLWVERNDKKRRAELILRESMENPHELLRL